MWFHVVCDPGGQGVEPPAKQYEGLATVKGGIEVR